MQQKGGLFSIQWQDAIKGFITAVITAALGVIYNIIGEGRMPIESEWKSIGVTALGAGLAYLLKNFFSNDEGQFAKMNTSSPTQSPTPSTPPTTTPAPTPGGDRPPVPPIYP